MSVVGSGRRRPGVPRKFLARTSRRRFRRSLSAPMAEDFARGEVRHAGKPPRGRPPMGDAPKQLVSLRLDPEIQARFRSSGPGRQTRMNTFLRHNETVLGMIVAFDEFIADMETLIGQLRAGEMRPVFQPVQASIAKVERNIRNTKETVRALREQLVWEPVQLKA